MSVIEFHTPANQLGLFPHPYPAIRAVPEWFKAVPQEAGGHNTVKRCPPFLEAMTAGYVIPAPCDVHFKVLPDGEMVWSAKYQIITTHFPDQYAGAPWERQTVVLFRNPWVIHTPPDYCALVTAPVNHHNTPLVPLTGLVETGAYYKEVHFPMILMLGPGQGYTVRRGDPVVQVIPFRREQWSSAVKPLDEARRTESRELFETNPHAYKDTVWKKLEWE